MKFSKYIVESSGKTPFSEILDALLKNCAPFMKEFSRGFNGKFLYSGRDDKRDWFIKDVRSDREPKDMAETVHQVLDDTFNKKFGFRARSNVIFVTGRWAVAVGYGTDYSIFPIGQYKYIYSKSVKDMYMDIDKMMEFEVKGKGMVDADKQKAEAIKKYKKEYFVGSNNGAWEYDDGKGLYVFYIKGKNETEAMKNVEKNLHKVEKFDKSDAIGKQEIINSLDKKYITWVMDVTEDEFVEEQMEDEDYDKGDEDFQVMVAERWLEKNLSSYMNRNIHTGIASENEIMLNCKNYLAINNRIYGKVLASYISKFKDKRMEYDTMKKWFDGNNFDKVIL